MVHFRLRFAKNLCYATPTRLNNGSFIQFRRRTLGRKCAMPNRTRKKTRPEQHKASNAESHEEKKPAQSFIGAFPLKINTQKLRARLYEPSAKKQTNSNMFPPLFLNHRRRYRNIGRLCFKTKSRCFCHPSPLQEKKYADGNGLNE